MIEKKYGLATTYSDGLMSRSDKSKLDSIPRSGGVSGVKGEVESTFRTGNVNITRANIGLGNVDNTSDADKPVSTATQTALNGKANAADVPFAFGIDENGNYGYYKEGADTVTPFKTGGGGGDGAQAVDGFYFTAISLETSFTPVYPLSGVTIVNGYSPLSVTLEIA